MLPYVFMVLYLTFIVDIFICYVTLCIYGIIFNFYCGYFYLLCYPMYLWYYISEKENVLIKSGMMRLNAYTPYYTQHCKLDRTNTTHCKLDRAGLIQALTSL